MSDRAEYIAGLRQLADLLDANPDLPVPTHGDVSWLIFSVGSGSETAEKLAAQKAQASVIVRAIPATWHKRDMDTLFQYKAKLRGLGIDVTVERAAVCERVVTSTETVTSHVPDPEAMAKVPLVEKTETVETVEWICRPLLSTEGGAL